MRSSVSGVRAAHERVPRDLKPPSVTDCGYLQAGGTHTCYTHSYTHTMVHVIYSLFECRAAMSQRDLCEDERRTGRGSGDKSFLKPLCCMAATPPAEHTHTHRYYIYT